MTEEKSQFADLLVANLRTRANLLSLNGKEHVDNMWLLWSASNRLEQLAAELSHVDAVLARRTALDDCTTRIDKILKCIATAAQVAALTTERNKLREALEQYADKNNWGTILEHGKRQEWWRREAGPEGMDGFAIARTALGKET